MPQSFNCPNCSAPLEAADHAAPTLRCPYCHTLVITPVELLGKSSDSLLTSSATAFNQASQVDLEEKLDFIMQTARAGNKMVAIKAIRETYSISLKQAVELVEAIQRGEQVDLHLLQLLTPKSSLASALDPAMMQQVVDRIKSGDKIEAIRLYRRMTGVGLKEAKDVVEGMEEAVSASPSKVATGYSPGIPYSSRSRDLNARVIPTSGGRNCLITGFVIFVVLVTVIPILAALSSSGGPLAGVWARINPFAMGRLTLAFGKEGTGPGYFTDARFISVDNHGHIFVSEYNGGRVQVFDEKGTYLTQWKATGDETGDIYLGGMAADRNGVVYTVVGSQLYVYDGLTGNLLGRLDHPDGWGFTDVAVTPDGSVVAAWYKNQDDIIRFDRNGQVNLLLQNAIKNITEDSEMDMRVSVDGTGNIYVLAYFNEAVFYFSADGRYISRFGSMGDAEGQFTSPRSIAVDNLGRIFIADFPGVMVFTSDGRYLDTLHVNGAVMGMTFDDQNNLYLVVDEQVLRYKLK